MQGVTIKDEIVEREIYKSTLISVLIGVVLTIGLAVAIIVKHALSGNIELVMLAIVAAIAMIGYARDVWRAYNNTWSEYEVAISTFT